MAPRKNSGTTLLVILQAWILPCHGFTYNPCGLGCSISAGASSFTAVSQPRPLKAAIPRGRLPSLSMSDEDEVRSRARLFV